VSVARHFADLIEIVDALTVSAVDVARGELLQQLRTLSFEDVQAWPLPDYPMHLASEFSGKSYRSDKRRDIQDLLGRCR
jgi:hypothetical protein